jgi:hypothetical protein
MLVSISDAKGSAHSRSARQLTVKPFLRSSLLFVPRVHEYCDENTPPVMMTVAEIDPPPGNVQCTYVLGHSQ